MKKQKKSALSLLLCGITVLSFASCQANPDSSIVKNKDLDKLIDAAQNPGTDNVGMDALAGKYDSYKTTLKDEKLGVTVNVDARVDIPEAEQLSVLRVEQTPITQEQLDAVRQALIGDTQLYDTRVLNEQTKAEIEEQISYYRNSIAEAKSNPDSYSAEQISSMEKEYQGKIDALQAAYESAPDGIVPDKYPSDMKIKPVSELYGAYPEQYSLEHDLLPEGSVYGGSGTYEGDYVYLHVLNSDNWSNLLQYRRDSVGIPYPGGVTADDELYWREGESPRSKFIDAQTMQPITGDTHPTDRVTLSPEDAKKQADTFLETVGLDAFGFYGGDRYYECEDYVYAPTQTDAASGTTFMRREYYVLTYTRVIDGAPVTPGTGKNSLAGGNVTGGNYTKKNWYVETITVKINDTGIVGFQLLSQLNIMETVVERTALQSFEKIKETFAQMVLVSNASESFNQELSVDRVTLGYALVSEADSYDTGLLVPVWDFIGTTVRYNKDDGSPLPDSGLDSSAGILLTVNAIGGSIIDRELGY